MLDIKWIRSNPDLFKAAMIKRGLAAFDHPTNKANLEKNGNPEEPDKKQNTINQKPKTLQKKNQDDFPENKLTEVPRRNSTRKTKS